MGCNNSTSAAPADSSSAPKAKPAAAKSGSKAPKYKLTYFNGMGRAELCRLIFAEAGVEYTDNRVEMADWPAMKPTTPFGSMPLLEIKGCDQAMCQCQAIARFLANEFGLAGKTSLEQFHVDMVCAGIVDLFSEAAGLGGDAEKTKKLSDETLPTALANLEKLVEGEDSFVSSGLTYADIYLWDTLRIPKAAGIEIPFDDCPKLKKVCAAVDARPNIANWVKERPETAF